MNYHEFMKAVDKKLLTMSEAEKSRWIHNWARTVEEERRAAFLNSLNEKEDYCPVIHETKEIENWCEKIENQEIYFERSEAEEYGDSYWDDDYSYEYSDNFGLGEELSRAFRTAEDLLFQRKYEQALDLYDRLCTISFPVLDRDIKEWNELDLEELVDENLVSLNLKQIALNLMYATYQTAGGRARAAALYQYFSWDMCKEVKVEELFIVGPEELKGTDAFMKEWISFLQNTPGDRAGDLLSAACLYEKDIRCLCETAQEAGARHPALYERACAYFLEEGKELECERLGLEAIERLPERLVIRGRIADLTAEAAARLNHPEILADCYQAAFDSESTLKHYLRLFELSDYKDRAGKGAKHAKLLPDNVSGEGYYNNQQMRTNVISQDQKKVISFFNKEFDSIYEDCRKDQEFLGWSIEFKGIAIPLFILLLDQNPQLTKAGQRLLNEIKFRLGYEEDNVTDLAAQFLYWKEKVALTDEHYKKYSLWLEKEVDKRVEAVVGGGYRKSYYKAAVLVTAWGETLESNGKLNGRRALIDYYKKLYTRKRAFKAEFEEFL